MFLRLFWEIAKKYLWLCGRVVGGFPRNKSWFVNFHGPKKTLVVTMGANIPTAFANAVGHVCFHGQHSVFLKHIREKIKKGF